MSDYADDVAAIAKDLSEMPFVMGRSMGGLLSMIVRESPFEWDYRGPSLTFRLDQLWGQVR